MGSWSPESIALWDPYDADAQNPLGISDHWTLTPRADFSKDLDLCHEADQGLCSSCRKMDFRGIFNFNGSKFDMMTTELCRFTGLRPSMMKSPCSLCRMLATLVFKTPYINMTSPGAKPTIDRVSGKLLALPASFVSENNQANVCRGSMALGIALDSNPREWDAILKCVVGIEAMVLPLTPGLPASNCLCGVTVQENLRFDRVREMLASCARDHPKCQQPTLDIPNRARVIDCRTRRLVPMKGSCRYLALSYVWGSARANQNCPTMNEEFFSAAYLPSDLPRTIEDALIVTKRIGLRYLWVDRYCIEQFHSEDKKHQLNQMANIYNRAVATLCGLGSHDEAGLPGVSQKRMPSQYLHAQGVQFATFPAPGSLQEHVGSSAWSTRGWTFQEALLSRRCIFFTTQQVYLVCRSSCQQESISQANIPLSEPLWDSQTDIPTTVLHFELQMKLKIGVQLHFYEYAQHYQKRHFSVDTDALAAFRAVLSVSSNQSYYGVVSFDCPLRPLDDSQATSKELSRDFLIRAGFVAGLLWSVEKFLESCDIYNNVRPSLPSWSWLARKHTLLRFVRLDDTSKACQYTSGLTCESKPVDPNAFVPAIWAVHDDASRVPLAAYFEAHQRSRVVPELTRYLDIHSIVAYFTWERKGIQATDAQCMFKHDKRGKTGYAFSCTWAFLTFDDSKARGGYGATIKTKEGLAILLFAQGPQPGSQPGSLNSHAMWCWLVVEPQDDDTHRRIGLLSFDSDSYDPTNLAPMKNTNTKSLMRTIRLG